MKWFGTIFDMGHGGCLQAPPRLLRAEKHPALVGVNEILHNLYRKIGSWTMNEMTQLRVSKYYITGFGVSQLKNEIWDGVGYEDSKGANTFLEVISRF